MRAGGPPGPHGAGAAAGWAGPARSRAASPRSGRRRPPPGGGIGGRRDEDRADGRVGLRLHLALAIGPTEGDGLPSMICGSAGDTTETGCCAEHRSCARPWGWWAFEAGEEMPLKRDEETLRLAEFGELTDVELAALRERANEAKLRVGTDREHVSPTAGRSTRRRSGCGKPSGRWAATIGGGRSEVASKRKDRRSALKGWRSWPAQHKAPPMRSGGVPELWWWHPLMECPRPRRPDAARS